MIGERGARTLVDPLKMPGARWFPDARFNFAENLLTRRAADDAGDALVFRGEDKLVRRVSHAELVATVSRIATALKALGIAAGDRIAAYVPNMPEAIEAMLGATSLGAVWSSCSPDFGVQGVLDRFGQIEPRVLFTVDGYWYNGKPLPILDKVADVVAKLPTVERVVVIPVSRGRRGRAAQDLSRIRSAVELGRVRRRQAGGADRVRAAAVRPSALHPVLLRHDGRAEVHRPRRGRNAAAAPEGAPAAQRRQGGRPAVLLHDVRLDDVELARVRTRERARR